MCFFSDSGLRLTVSEKSIKSAKNLLCEQKQTLDKERSCLETHFNTSFMIIGGLKGSALPLT